MERHGSRLSARAVRSRVVRRAAAEHPDATAIVLGGERWSYRELNERSNQWVRFLRARGVGPESRVAICLERSPTLIMAVLAVLKAGGGYVPVNPAFAGGGPASPVHPRGRAGGMDGDRFQPFRPDWPGGATANRARWRGGERDRRRRLWQLGLDRLCGEPGLYPLHVRLDGPPEGRDGHARQSAERLFRLGKGCTAWSWTSARICRWPASASTFSRATWCGPSLRAGNW